MKDNMNSIEKSLIVPEKENIFSKFFKWIKNIFNKPKEIEYVEVKETITIPKAVKMPIYDEKIDEIDENSLEYLYKLTDDELDKIEKDYNLQMEQASSEIAKLEDILKSYKETIKKLQNNLSSEEI